MWQPSPERIGPDDFGNLRRDNCAAIAISAIDKLSPIKYFLLIRALDKASNIFCSSKLSLVEKTTLEILTQNLQDIEGCFPQHIGVPRFFGKAKRI